MSFLSALMGLVENQNTKKLWQQDHISFLAWLGHNGSRKGGGGQAEYEHCRGSG
jgi:hypothetical protein